MPMLYLLKQFGIFITVINTLVSLVIKNYASAALCKDKTGKLDSVRIPNHTLEIGSI